MGVLGLLTLVRSNELGEHVNLADIAAEYRKKTGKRPVLLVDTSSSTRFLYSGRSFQLAAELKKFKENCQEFLNRFHDLDIQLYIIEGGLKANYDVQPWMESTDQLVESLSLAYSKRDITLANVRLGYEYRIAMGVFTSSDKCEFHRSTSAATDYIAQYLKQNGAFGVISNNSDVILMEGSHYCLSIEDLDLSKMTTFNFNRDKLIEFLNIEAHLLPHVGTLRPNNFLTYQDLKKFFGRYCRKADKCDQFKIVADVVKKHLSDFDPGDYSPKRLQYCQSNLCLNVHQVELYMKRLKMLNGKPDEELKSMENKHWNDILTLTKILHREGRIDRVVLELFLEKSFFCGIGLENVKMPTPGEELQNLRRKIYGFLFSEYPEEISVTEHIYACRNGMAAYFSCEVTFERRDHVGLLELWSADAPEDIQKKKYKYFFEMINEKLHPDILVGKVDEEFIFPVLAAFYLHHELGKFNYNNMMNVFLIHSILANKLSASEVAELDLVTDFDVVNLQAWYLRVIDHLDLLNSVCGHPFDRSKTNIVNYFDGLLLQTVYRDINGGKGIPEGVIPTLAILKKAVIEMKQRCAF